MTVPSCDSTSDWSLLRKRSQLEFRDCLSTSMKRSLGENIFVVRTVDLRIRILFTNLLPTFDNRYAETAAIVCWH
jgi:hypothetical protein